MSTVYFAERRESVHVLRRSAQVTAEVGRYLGMGRSVHGDGTRYQYAAGVVDAGGVLSKEDAGLVAGLDGPWPIGVDARDALADLAADIVTRAEALGLRQPVASLRSYDQQIAAGQPGSMRGDRRHFCTVNLEAGDGDRIRVRRDSATAGLTGLSTLATQLLELLPQDLQRARKLPETTLAPAMRPVVLEPGACAVVFHELCGHPLEADVVASGQSYLDRLRGSRIAPDWLTVLDDPAAGTSFGYRIDDEGVPAEPVPLIQHGVVGDLMHSRDTAAAAAGTPNGHGRRMGYLYPAIPRQAHTRVLPGPTPPDQVTAAAGETVSVSRLRVRYVHLRTGEFSFHAPQALLLDRGVPVARLRDVHLFGDGRSALGTIEAVGTEPAAWIGGGGCGKLNQGPLIVGFEQPAIRIGALRTVSLGGSP
ncbi:MAG TPA: TldD/PmbA family protein [Candidatus Limnocylindrales bacterium]|nr:TldD/PmbA family protein [Candidatus Limnocylindrales bacterium]